MPDRFDPPPFTPRVVTVRLYEFKPGRYVSEDGRIFASRENPARPRIEIEDMLDRLRGEGTESAAEEVAGFSYRSGEIEVERPSRGKRRRLTLCPECRSVLNRGVCPDCGKGDLTCGTPRARVEVVGHRRIEVERHEVTADAPVGA